MVQSCAESGGKGTFDLPNISLPFRALRSEDAHDKWKKIISSKIEIFQMDVLKPKDDPPETVSFSLVQYDTPKRYLQTKLEISTVFLQ